MQKREEVLDILEHVREALKNRGTKTIAGLGRTFRQLDSFDGNKKVDKQEFKEGLRENGADLDDREVSILLDFFDTDKDGKINFDEFLVGIRGKLNPRRKAIVEKAFLKFNKNDEDDWIDAEDLKQCFDVTMHPKYQSGEMTKEEIFDEYLANMGDKNRDGKITKDEWFDYYAAVSANIDNDDHFFMLMRNAWKFDEF